MIKKIISLMLCSFLLFSLTGEAAWAANKVSDINVEVAIFEDGSAYITQTWNCNFTEGTEGYIPIENLGEMSISDFLVSDSDGPYTYIDNWDVKASFQEKIKKYGIVKTSKGYELCWGISEYGERRYAIEYKINKMVGGYQDFDGFNFQFINPGMGTLPTDVTVKILMQDGIQLNAENAGIWAFGFDGQINFENGQVVAYTQKPLSSDTDSVIIMLQLNKGLITPTRVVDKSFEAVKEEAFKGSDYDTGTGGDAMDVPEEPLSLLGWVILLLTMGLPIFGILFFVIRRRKYNKILNALYKKADFYREVPLEGNLEAAFVLANDFKQINDEEDLIGAAFLKLINAGCLEPIVEKSVGFFGKEKESVNLSVVKPPDFPGVTTKLLYDLLVLASGSDQILQEQELEKYCTKNHTAMTNIIDTAKVDGNKVLREFGSYDNSKVAKPLGLSEQGKGLLLNIMGFKKYLLEFSLIAERGINESLIWQDYLTFATLLGIADKAIEQFKKVYPTATPYSEKAYYSYFIAHRYAQTSYHAAQSARSSGGGGSSSIGGGGGFSGGGMGGGAR